MLHILFTLLVAAHAAPLTSELIGYARFVRDLREHISSENDGGRLLDTVEAALKKYPAYLEIGLLEEKFWHIQAHSAARLIGDYGGLKFNDRKIVTRVIKLAAKASTTASRTALIAGLTKTRQDKPAAQAQMTANLLRVLDTHDLDLAKIAIAQMGRTHAAPALTPLLKLAHEAASPLRAGAIRALGNFPQEKDARMALHLIAINPATPVPDLEAAVEALSATQQTDVLQAVLAQGRPGIDLILLRFAAELEDPWIAEFFRQSLKSEEWPVRRAGIENSARTALLASDSAISISLSVIAGFAPLPEKKLALAALEQRAQIAADCVRVLTNPVSATSR